MEHLYHRLQGSGNIMEQGVQRVQELEGGGEVVRHKMLHLFLYFSFFETVYVALAVLGLTM